MFAGGLVAIAPRGHAQRPNRPSNMTLLSPVEYIHRRRPAIEAAVKNSRPPQSSWLTYALALGLVGDSLRALEIVDKTYTRGDSLLVRDVVHGYWEYSYGTREGTTTWSKSPEQEARLDWVQLSMSGRHPADVYLLSSAAEAFERIGREADALALLDSAIRLGGDSSIVLLRARAYLRIGRTTEARESYERLHATYPDWDDACWGLEEYLNSRNDRMAAGRVAKDCLVGTDLSLEYFVPTDTAILRVHGAGLARDLRQALRIVMATDDLAPEYRRMSIRGILAQSLELDGDTAGALEVRREEVGMCTSWCGSKHFALGNDLFGLRRYEEALRAFEDAYGADTSNVTALFDQGAALGSMGQDSAARVAYARYVVRVPEDPEGWVRLGYTSGMLNDSRRSAAFFEKALRLEPGLFDQRDELRVMWESATRSSGRQSPANTNEVVGLLGGGSRRTTPRVSRAITSPDSDILATGSGFVVGDGRIVATNAHVIQACRRVTVVGPDGQLGKVDVLASDRANDLALLRSGVNLGRPLPLRGQSPSVGTQVIALGFPLRGTLADQVIVTSGIISATAGLGNDSRLLQTTAAVQPGNSGGPLVDETGAVLGVVVGKLDAARVFAIQGVIPEGIGFAIKSGVLKEFARSYSEAIVEAGAASRMSVTEVVSSVKHSVVLVQCRR